MAKLWNVETNRTHGVAIAHGVHGQSFGGLRQRDAIDPTLSVLR